MIEFIYCVIKCINIRVCTRQVKPVFLEKVAKCQFLSVQIHENFRIFLSRLLNCDYHSKQQAFGF